MKLLPYPLCFLLLSLSAHSALDCSRLESMAKDLEEKIQSSNLVKNNCDKLSPEDLYLNKDSAGLTQPFDYRCKDLSAIELQLKSIENEIALFKGIDSLKADIDAGTKILGKPSKRNIDEEANRFRKNLEIAKTLELFFATQNDKENNILSLIAANKEEWSDIHSFASIVGRYCLGIISKEGTVCQKDFKITDDVYAEINQLIKTGKKTQRSLDKSQVEELSKSLAIANNGGPYSYTELSKKLSLEGPLTKADIDLLKELNLSNSNKISFLNELNSSQKQLKKSQDIISAQDIPQRFKNYLTELYERQKWELKSKLSWALAPYANESNSEFCKKAKNLEGPIKNCLEPILKNLNADQKAKLQGYLEELISGENYLNRLSLNIEYCIPNEKLQINNPQCTSAISASLGPLVEKSQYLNALRTKILHNQQETILLRNFALETLQSQECMTTSESKISPCHNDIGQIPQEIIVLSGGTLDILYTFEKPKSPTQITKFCNLKKESDIPHLRELCELSLEINKNKTATKARSPRTDYPLEPESSNQSGQYIGQALKNLASGIAGILAPPPTVSPSINPYDSMYRPSSSGKYPQTIVGEVMGDAVAARYGEYVPIESASRFFRQY